MSPPYWPFRCKQCSRFVSNPQVWVDGWGERIVRERGDCSRCGEDVDLAGPLAWEDWFGYGDDPEMLESDA